MNPVLLAALRRHHGVFATADALASGVDRNAIGPLLRQGSLHRIRYGVMTLPRVWDLHAARGTTHHLECAAVLRRLERPQSVISHTSAARLHGLVLPGDVDQQVWLTDPEQYRTGRGYRVLEAPVPPSETTVVDGLPVTTLTRTLADVGRGWSFVDTVVAADDALADGRCTRAELTAAAMSQSHWVGAGKTARALGAARVGAHSPHETRSRLAVVGAGLPEPLLQVAVWRGSRLVGVLDFLFEGTPVFGDCDGRVKVEDPWGDRTPAEVIWAEKIRHDEMLDLDLLGVRLKPADLFGPLPHKVERFRELLARGGRPSDHCRLEVWNGGLRRQPRVARAS